MDFLSIIFGAVVILSASWMSNNREDDFKKFLNESAPKYNLPTVETYDFVIVGGGLAGSYLASALSESHSVLLLEMSGDPPPTSNVPSYAPYYYNMEELGVEHVSSPHQFASLENGGIIRVPTGKVLGGSSITNGLVYNRGSPYDYDLWANMTQDSSWNYASLLPFFRGVETYLGEFPVGTEHGTSGPMRISKQNFAPGRENWIEAGRELGYDKKDPNGPQTVGFSPIEYNTWFGRRDSVFDAFLKPILDVRPSLNVIRYAEAKQILLDPTNKIATGVRYTRHSMQDQFAFANKEVIISAGTFGSPKLLLNSGIGPFPHLIEAGVEPKVNLPVGRNLQDHTGVSIQYLLNTSAPEFLFFTDRDISLESVTEFELTGEGPLTYAWGGSIAEAFLSSTRAGVDGIPNWPDIQIALLSSNSNGNSSDPSSWFIANEISIGRPVSRGYLQLNTTNPAGPVDFGFGFFTDPDNTDIGVIVEAIKIGFQLFENTTAYGRLGARASREKIKNCEGFFWGEDDYWKCFIMQKATTGWHPVGTCPMGFGVDDPTAVLDSKLRVLGVDGLRVIDASIMPQITNSNTQAPTLVIAVKAAQDVLNFWGEKQE